MKSELVTVEDVEHTIPPPECARILARADHILSICAATADYGALQYALHAVARRAGDGASA